MRRLMGRRTMRNRNPAAGRPNSVKKLAATKFEPCDRQKYPVVTQEKFMEGMERVGKIAYAAHLAAYFTKPQIVQMMLGLEQGEAPKVFEDLEEARKVF